MVADGSTFSVRLDDDCLVDELKKPIKADSVTGEADLLTLYLAKRGGNKDGPWLSVLRKDDAEAIASLLLREIPQDVQETYLKKELEMNSLFRNQTFGFPKDDTREDGEIHVLVELPTSRPAKKKRFDHGYDILRTTLAKIEAFDSRRIFDITSVVEVPFPSLSATPNRFHLNDGCFQYQARQTLSLCSMK